MLAHELGHQFGLLHTFSDLYAYPSFSFRLAELARNGERDPLPMFDGDSSSLVSDTPADAGAGVYETLGFRLWDEKPPLKIHVTGKDGQAHVLDFRPDPYNHMSYFFEARQVHPSYGRICGYFSQDQCEIMNRLALLRFETAGSPIDHSTTTGLNFEFESLPSSGKSGVSLEVQGTPVVRLTQPWSGGKHLWVRAEPEATVTFDFAVSSAGAFDLWFTGSNAPDYGIIQFIVNGVRGAKWDAFANGWLPTGRRKIGRFELVQGANHLEVRSVGKHRLSLGYSWGLDRLTLVKAQL